MPIISVFILVLRIYILLYFYLSSFVERYFYLSSFFRGYFYFYLSSFFGRLLLLSYFSVQHWMKVTCPPLFSLSRTA